MFSKVKKDFFQNWERKFITIDQKFKKISKNIIWTKWEIYNILF